MINKTAILIFRLVLYPLAYFRRKRSNPHDGDIKNILFVNTTGIGDTILSTPAWQLLRERFPNAAISLMVHERRSDVAGKNPLIDNIIIYRKFIYFFRIIRKLRRLNIDVAIIFHGNDPDILPLVFLGGAKEIIGYKRRTRLPYLLTTSLDLLSDHFITAQIKLAEAVAGKGETSPPAFYLSDEERDWAGQFLKQNSLTGRVLAGILPGSGRPYKRWPLARFIALAAHFLGKINTAVIIFGSKKEIALGAEIEKESERFLKNAQGSRLVNTTGSLNLRQTSAIIERLNLFVTNDSGPLHIAIALGTPTLALFSPTDPGGLLPFVKNHKLKIIKKDLTCKPCITKKCVNPFCMERISVEEVIKAAEEVISDENPAQ